MAPSVLILGGTGFIGRNLVSYLVSENLAGAIRVVDKCMPELAFLHPSHKKAFDDPRCEFRQGDVSRPAVAEKMFTRDDNSTFDYVFNLAAETKYGLSEEIYEEKVYTLAITVGKEAAKRGVKCFVQASTAQVYEAQDKKPAKEDHKIKPWTGIAKCLFKAEEELKKIPRLNLVIVRPAVVYGPGDIYGITPRLIMGAIYRQLAQEMKLLWTASLKINTVHVSDVVRALWWVAATGDEKGGRKGAVVGGGEVYNLADGGDSNQETINTHIRSIFGITTGYQGTIISSFAKLNLDSVTEDVNDMHLQPWADLCKAGGVANTPLSPYLDRELLKDNELYVDGGKIESTGFKYTHPTVTEASLREVIDGFVEVGVWPKGTTK
ncbi:NAD(P)-binding protein [Gonapodya prolifera JEL478]|uniref:NAD(P)-binding protein n=1 Tax=Gonapodya prolifera (strain JEL478) TaxID=1344416 RepID=A0A139AIL1_GONPJ|nr:NAD(P)-binding protein [Gonapodya prolifera JEL478]|eukprot:KXS16630.1 NAD(P)-binding protein [Gonapodya prolifera JEL478]